MKPGWDSKSLGEVCELLKRGIAPKYIENGGVRVVNQKCVRGHSVNYQLARRNNTNLRKVPDERIIRVGDVLVNSTGTGTLGRVAQIRSRPCEPTTVDTHVTIVRPKSGLFYPDFFGYMMIKIEDEIIDSGEGSSGQTELPRQKLSDNFRVSFPVSKAEQKRIVEVLDAAFAKIDRLEAIAKRNIENWKDGFAAILKQSFSENSENWIEAELNAHVKFVDYRGKTPPKRPEGIRLITAKNVKMGVLNVEPKEFIDSSVYDTWMTRGTPQNGDVLFTTEAPLANVAQLDTNEKVVVGQRLITMQPDLSVLDNTFLKYLMMSPEIQSEIHSRGTGTTVIGIKAKLLKTVIIKFPRSLSDQGEIVKKLDQATETTNNAEQNLRDKLKFLAQLRQSLLAKAFAGELVEMIEGSASLGAISIPANDNYTYHAGAIAYADSYFRNNAPDTFHGRTIFEKVVQAAETIAGIELGRQAVQGIRGPTDDKQRDTVEVMASEKDYFSFESTGGKGMKLQRGRNFNELRLSFEQKFQAQIPALDKFLRLIAPMPTRDVEVLSTVHTAWNNYLIEKQTPTNEQIVYAACEGWHEEKTKIPRHKFFTAIETLRERDLVPTGQGKYVGKIAGQSFDF